MNVPGSESSRPYIVRTTTDHDPFNLDEVGLTCSNHELLVWGDGLELEELPTAATLETFVIDPRIEPQWFLAMDAHSQDLCDIGEALLSTYDDICASVQFDAARRGAGNGRFTVIGLVETGPDHRGNGYGLTLLHEVITMTLRTSMFVVGAVADLDSTIDNFDERTNSMVEMLQNRTGARQLNERMLVIP